MTRATSEAKAPKADGASGGTPAGTVGEMLARDPAIAGAVRTIVDRVRAASSRITDVRPALPGRAESYEALMGRAADVRGRPLLYPFIGSGVGNGALVELADGSVKWDMICGIGVHFFGHSDPGMVEAAAAASIGDTVKHGNLLSGFEPYRWGETLVAEARRASRLRHAYVATSGAMANENALKVCFQKKYLDLLHAAARNPGAKPEALLAQATPTMRAIAFEDCFMGRSMTMAHVGDNHQGREGLPNGVHVDYMPFWNPREAAELGPGAQGKKKFIDLAVTRLERLVHRYPGGHACFIFELVQGEGGFNVGDRDYFLALIEVCKANGIAVWDDEIQTFGRLPRMFAYEHFDLGEHVDVLCVGKMTMACATLWTEAFNPKTALLSGTFTGEGVSFAVGQRVIERLRDGGYYGDTGSIARHVARFQEQARALMARRPLWFPPVPELGPGTEELVGGLGGMMRLTPFGGAKDRIMAACKSCFKEGVIVFYCGHGPYHLRMLPPLGVMDERDWPRVFECLERGLASA